MRTLQAVLVPWVLLGLIAAPVAGEGDEAKQVLDRFFDASGGLEKLRDLKSVSFTARIDAYDYEYTQHLLADGRFRIEEQNRTTIFDGRDYWRSYYGVVQKLSAEQSAPYQDNSLRRTFLHDLLDADGRPVQCDYAGRETTRGEAFERLTTSRPDGSRRTYYFSAATGLLAKIVELVPDSTLHERKIIHDFRDYQETGGFVLPTTLHALCITTGDEPQPLARLKDLMPNATLDAQLFARPESAAPPVTVADGVASACVIGMSPRGSLITNITAEDLNRLGAAVGDTLVAVMRERESRLAYLDQLQTVASGNYVATFNDTPVLWLVKAYVGMTSDLSYAVGDAVRLRVLQATGKEAQR